MTRSGSSSYKGRSSIVGGIVGCKQKTRPHASLFVCYTPPRKSMLNSDSSKGRKNCPFRSSQGGPEIKLQTACLLSAISFVPVTDGVKLKLLSSVVFNSPTSVSETANRTIFQRRTTTTVPRRIFCLLAAMNGSGDESAIVCLEATLSPWHIHFLAPLVG